MHVCAHFFPLEEREVLQVGVRGLRVGVAHQAFMIMISIHGRIF